MLRPLSGPCILLATAPTTPPCFCHGQRSSSLHLQRKKFLYLRLSWPAGHSKRIFTNKAQTVRCSRINSFEEKPIDKSHKKRYILFINALKKSVHCICRSESRRMLRIRYGRAVCCHFGAGAVSEEQAALGAVPRYRGIKGRRMLCAIWVVPRLLQPSHGTFRGTAFFRPTSSFFTGRTL